MNNEQENFEKLCLLLSVKRHEQPPPGYFDRLPREIISRIRAEEARGKIAADTSWWQRVWNVLDAKPVLAGSFGVAVCGLLLAGFAFNMAPETEPVNAALPMPHLFAGNLAPAPVTEQHSGMVSLSVMGGSSMFPTGGVVSLAPQIATPARHPYALPVNSSFR
jgi:hypothetical protein